MTPARVNMDEKPKIGIVGVGEGATRQLRALFRSPGIAEQEWVPVYYATQKTCIAFAYPPLSRGCMFASGGGFAAAAKLGPALDRIDLPRIAEAVLATRVIARKAA